MILGMHQEDALMIRWNMQQDVAVMIRMIIDDELQDVAPDDMQQDVAVMMIRMIMDTSG